MYVPCVYYSAFENVRTATCLIRYILSKMAVGRGKEVFFRHTVVLIIGFFS